MKYDTEDLKDQLVKHEGLRLQVYKDPVGIDTIGVGRNLESRGIATRELKMMNKTMKDIYKHGITRAEAMYLLANDIEDFEIELAENFPVVETLSAERQMVLVNMAFNLGIGGISQFNNMWKAIEQGNYDKAAEEMLDSRWARQVGYRAKELAEQMSKDSYKWGVDITD